MKKARLGEVLLESGDVLQDVEVAYQTYGTYDPDRGNAILVCHALTGTAYAVTDEEHEGWWDGLIGPGKPVDTDKYFVICSNVLGGCYGTTGPASLNPRTNRPYGSSFPVVTVRDMVRTQRKLLTVLGVDHLYAVIGGSMGGMQVYEWLVEYPDLFDLAVPIATCARMSAVGIAYNDVGRQAICSDPEWKNGDYYPGEGPRQGLSIARMVGMLTYRTTELFEERFGRNMRDQVDNPLTGSVFQIESYLRYQGEKLVNRFDANSYLHLMKAMDTHDIGRGRGGIPEAISRIQARVLAIGIQNDLIYPVDHQREMVELMKQHGVEVEFHTIDSIYGHDAFLVDFHKIAPLITPYFA